MTTQYDYNIKLKIDDAQSINEAIEYTIINYMHYQLGWTLDDCKKRVITESNREIPKGVLNYLEGTGWEIKGRKIIEKEFNLALEVGKLIDVYNKILKSQ